MSLDIQDPRGATHGAAAGGASATPGKHTLVASLAHPAAATHEHPASTKASGASAAGVNLATLQSFIAKHEGNVDHVYLDSRGFPTAGIGHLLAGSGMRVGQKVSAEQVTAWFQEDVAEAVSGAKRDMGSAYDRLDEARKMVVIDMVFNLGSRGFGSFHETIQAIQAGAYSQAADRMLQSLWASQVGNRATEDAAIMRSGHLTGGGGTGGAGAGGSGATGGGATGAGGSHATSLGEVREGRAVLKLGAHGAAVAKLQHLLHVSADGIFGAQTLHAVETFQRTHHLTVDGIVGETTLETLEHKPPAKPHGAQPPAAGGTGGVAAPTGGGGGAAHPAHPGAWLPAPSLEAVKSGAATLHAGEKGAAVTHVQRLLSVEADGEFGPATRTAVLDFEHAHHMKRHDGEVDAHTLALLTAHPPGSVDGESKNGSSQRDKLLGIARAGSAGRRPDGRCYFHVCQFLVQCGGYGKITNPYTQFSSQDLPEAHDFANLMNAGGSARFGLEKLGLNSPYDAPAGSIVVVAAGSPGTSNPTAGDIAVADGSGNFYNGGLMGYSGREGWSASPHARLLGVYIPK